MSSDRFSQAAGNLDWLTVPEMNPVECMFWRVDSVPGMRANLVGIVLLDRSPDWDRLVTRCEWLGRTVPWLHERVVEPPLRWGRPFWTPAADFDVHQHVGRVRLAAPGSPRQLLDIAQAMFATPFDATRPLWEALLVEGVDGHGAAVVFKVHHSVTDGMGAAQMLFALHDTSPEPGPATLVPPWGPDRVARGVLVARRLARLLRRGATGAARLATRRRGGTAAAPTARPSARDLPRVLDELAHATVLPSVPPLPLLAHRNRFPRFEVMDLSLAELRAAGRAAGGSLNDVYLAALVGAFQRYHQRFGLSVDAVPTVLPISVRRPGDPPGGNRLASTRMALPGGAHSAAERIRLIREQVRQVRTGPALRALDLLSRPLMLMPPGVVAATATQMFRGNDLLASNFAGMPVQVYLAGAKVTGFHPFPPLLRGAVSVALVSYQDRAQLGINLDSGAITEPEEFMRALHESVEEIRGLIPRPAPDRAPARA
jgi:WS/DGAT/MGAT family acyltransferase